MNRLVMQVGTMVRVASCIGVLLFAGHAAARPPCPAGMTCMYSPDEAFVLVITNLNDPATVQFYVTGFTQTFNIRQGSHQYEVKTREVITLPRGSSAQGTKVQAQHCLKGYFDGLFQSRCGAWANFTVVAPRTNDCQAYTDKAMTAVADNLSLNCGNAGDRWKADSRHHFDWCMGLGVKDLHFTQSETAAREQAIQACKTKASTATPASPPKEPLKPVKCLGGAKCKGATVVLDVEVFDASDGKGNRLGVLRAGSVVRFSGSCPKDWCNVVGDAVPTGKGWVYNGADYRSLKF